MTKHGSFSAFCLFCAIIKNIWRSTTISSLTNSPYTQQESKDAFHKREKVGRGEKKKKRIQNRQLPITPKMQTDG
jgi:hypothetical protein